jgi:HrpA-like RNA helicase
LQIQFLSALWAIDKHKNLEKKNVKELRADCFFNSLQLVSNLILHLADVCLAAPTESNHSILVFLPGQSEIFMMMDFLETKRHLHMVVLHSSVPQKDQEAVLASPPTGTVMVQQTPNHILLVVCDSIVIMK